jgi:hypothetical protein
MRDANILNYQPIILAWFFLDHSKMYNKAVACLGCGDSPLTERLAFSRALRLA